MKKILFTIFCSALMVSTATFAGQKNAQCGDAAAPLLSVSDFNADGIVNDTDVSMMAKHMRNKGGYYALYDRNADGALTRADMKLVVADAEAGRTSTAFDQRKAKLYVKFSMFQNMQGAEALMGAGYNPIPVSLRGHGVHWFNQAGMGTMMGMKPADPNGAEGLNVDSTDLRVHALFWAAPGMPVFGRLNADGSYTNLGASDYPNGTQWRDLYVIAFSNMPPKFTESEDEMWHNHGGLCMTGSYGTDANGNPTILGRADQYLTFNQCQALESVDEMRIEMPDGSKVNLWANFYMIHFWMYNLNPRGFFAGTHPCVEPDGPSEESLMDLIKTIESNWTVPEWFRHM